MQGPMPGLAASVFLQDGGAAAVSIHLNWTSIIAASRILNYEGPASGWFFLFFLFRQGLSPEELTGHCTCRHRGLLSPRVLTSKQSCCFLCRHPGRAGSRHAAAAHREVLPAAELTVSLLFFGLCTLAHSYVQFLHPQSALTSPVQPP